MKENTKAEVQDHSKWNPSDRDIRRAFEAHMATVTKQNDSGLECLDADQFASAVREILAGRSAPPDIYSGALNEKRIRTYRLLAEGYTTDEGTIRDAFCAGADFYRSLLTKTDGNAE
jgi:hypothetical protein